MVNRSSDVLLASLTAAAFAVVLAVALAGSSTEASYWGSPSPLSFIR
jgi:hypothetical protein